MNYAVDESALKLVDLALAEDRGSGDWTTRWIVPARKRATATVMAHEEGVLAGLSVMSAVFLRLDARVEVTAHCSDGDSLKPGDTVCIVRGPARALLTGERTALNFMRHLSGVATATRKFVEAVRGTTTEIIETRDATPAWRALERAAVRVGGGQNNRAGLYDMLLITPEHSEIAGGVAKAIQLARESNKNELRLAVEVREKDDLKAALDSGCDRLVLRDMDVQAIREAVRVARKASSSIEVEATGNMTLERVRAVAETGVDFISVSALTKSVAALDLSIKLQTA